LADRLNNNISHCRRRTQRSHFRLFIRPLRESEKQIVRQMLRQNLLPYTASHNEIKMNNCSAEYVNHVFVNSATNYKLELAASRI